MKGSAVSLTPGSSTAGSGAGSSHASTSSVGGGSNGSGMRSAYGNGGNDGAGTSNQLAEAWSIPGNYFTSASLPARTTRGHGHAHQLSGHYDPSSTPLPHEYAQQQQYMSRQSQHDQQQQQQVLLSQSLGAILQHPLHTSSQSRPVTAATPISVSTPASSLPSLVDWPTTAGLGPSPFVQRIQQEAMNNPGGVSVSVSVPVRPGTSSGYGGLSAKRAWGGPDGPAGPSR